MLVCPKEISISNIIEKKSLSPKNFSKIDITKNEKVPLSFFLDKENPFFMGEEPGSFAYVRKSDISFIRNSCIDSQNFSHQVSKEICLNPKYAYKNFLTNDDVLLCKDANIGDSAIFIPEEKEKYIISSGLVKLNFKSRAYKYYCFAFLRDKYFLNQLDSKTPKGSTIRHAGSKFLECLIPTIGEKEKNLLGLIEVLVKNISYSERISYKKLEQSNMYIKKEFLVKDENYQSPSISSFLKSSRLDAGYYSETVNDIKNSIFNYKFGHLTLNDAGFTLKRGPNLAKRDLGRSVKSEDFKKNYHLLVYPSDISDNGYILKEIYIGARNPVWYLKSGDILFSAEGTVGKVFIICDEEMKFITNFHGLIISPKNKNQDLKDSIILGQYLNFLRSYEYFDKVSVGGQGGSFAVNYWEDFKIPNFSQELKDNISKLYHSGTQLRHDFFSLSELNKAGVFELNQFRIECNEIIKSIVKDIKNNKTKELDSYIHMFK